MDNMLIFVLAIILIGTTASVINNWIRARHGFEPETRGRERRRRRGGGGDIDADRQIALLTNENDGLKGQVVRLEERIAVLERIATDPAERTAREIEALR